MIRYYLAGPMSGKPHFNYPAFEDAAKRLRAAGMTVTSPHELHGDNVGRPWADCLRVDLRAMLECDAVIMLRGWRESAGAVLEHRVAQAVGMQCYEYADVIARLRRRTQLPDDGLSVLRVTTRHPQDYVLVNEADGTRWRGNEHGAWQAEPIAGAS